MERAIAGNCRAPDNGAKGKYKGKYEAENGTAAALRDSRPHMTYEKAPCDYRISSKNLVQN